MKDQRVAVLGLGKIGNILLQGLLKAGLPPKNAVATVRHPERAQSLGKERAVPVGTDNRAAVRGADVVIIAVKPQNVRELLEEIRGDVTPAPRRCSSTPAITPLCSRIPSRRRRAAPSTVFSSSKRASCA